MSNELVKLKTSFWYFWVMKTELWWHSCKYTHIEGPTVRALLRSSRNCWPHTNGSIMCWTYMITSHTKSDEWVPQKVWILELLEVENKCQTCHLKKLGHFQWWLMSNEWGVVGIKIRPLSGHQKWCQHTSSSYFISINSPQFGSKIFLSRDNVLLRY